MNYISEWTSNMGRNKQLALVGAIVALICVGFASLIGLGGPASAHTPNAWADCDGVHVTGVNYQPDQANRWSVTINGATQTGTFGSSLDQVFPVPQDGATTTWAAMVEAENGDYHGDFGGSVGPCGDTPTPTPTPPTPTPPTPTPTEPTEPPTLIPPTSDVPPQFKQEQRFTCAWVYTVKYAKKDGGPWVEAWRNRRPTGAECTPGKPYSPNEEGM